MANERYLLKFIQASIKSGVNATEYDKSVRIAADRIRKITEILTKWFLPMNAEDKSFDLYWSDEDDLAFAK